MQIKNAKFVTSSKNTEKCPPANLPEYAFIGRSNVGKSSLINMITGEKKLAKTSSTPGKTQLINHFIINESWYIADLPGFGYAKISKEIRDKWEQMIKNYLLKRKNLLYTFVLVDSRLDPQNIDLEFMEWLGTNSIPFIIIFTKTDKLTKNELVKNIEHYKKILSESWEELPDMILTSVTLLKGKDEILNVIEKTNLIYTEI
ncbi:MAG: YihA family ribosome biogenesis GTP-binding protein [Bacteroidetes bacterium]|nr:YihA family ribosome biogenesis GTP-binding protein [Bacteroidota bacterium]